MFHVLIRGRPSLGVEVGNCVWALPYGMVADKKAKLLRHAALLSPLKVGPAHQFLLVSNVVVLLHGLIGRRNEAE